MTQTATGQHRRRDAPSADSHTSIVINNDPRRSQFLAGDFISENAVRRMFGRRGDDTPPSAPTEQANGPSAKLTASNKNTPASDRPLRRWSVAKLIAHAAAAPPTDYLGHR